MKNLNSCRVNVMISNMDDSIKFYSDILGLAIVNRYGDHYAELQGPGLMLGLHPTSSKITVGNNITIGFGVKAFDETMSELASEGIDLELEQDGWIRLAYFQDPDKNQLFLAENK